MSNFDRKSNYDKDSGIVEVQIGMEKPVLEVELNELQEIARERVRKVVSSTISDGAFSDTGISYSGGKVKVVNTTFIIDGELIFVDNLELPASNNDEVFIKVWDKQVTGEDILKKYGNEQGEVIPNKIIDERVGEETSRRIVLAYDLVKSLEQNEKGLKLGKIVNGNLVLETKIILPLNEVKDLLAGKVDIGNLTKADVGLNNVDNVKQASKTEFDTHNNDSTRHITSDERNKWNNKANKSDIPTKVSQLENDENYVTQEDIIGRTIPSGIITMWSGSISNIPKGWVLCDGQNGTPDLRDRFIVGAGKSYSVGNTGGANSVTLTVDNLPAHSHTMGSAGSHSHTGSTNSSGSHTHSYSRPSGNYIINPISSGSRSVRDSWINDTTGSAGGHSHSLSINSAGSHTHTINNTGGGKAHENRPPYYALAFIMKI